MLNNKILNNPFGETWLEDIKRLLPTIKAINVSEDNLLIDGNRRFIIIWGHDTKTTIWQTKILGEGSNLRITTTALVPHIIINLIAPLGFIIIVWIGIIHIYISGLLTIVCLISPIQIIRSLSRQEVFNDILKGELERAGGT